MLNADRIVFIDKGEVVEEGTYSELMAKKGRFFQLNKENQVETGELTGETTAKVEPEKRKTFPVLFIY